MRIGILGSGMIGGTLARLCVDVGHEVAIANSRGPGSLAGLVADLGPNARAATSPDAIQFGELVVIAVPFGRYTDLPAEPFAGRITVDTTNSFGRDDMLRSGDVTSSELVAKHLRSARLVKAFNTLNFRVLGSAGRPGAPRDQRLVVFVAGDDVEAKRVVSDLVEQLGFAAVDTGGLVEGGRRQQPGSPVFNVRLRPHEVTPDF